MAAVGQSAEQRRALDAVMMAMMAELVIYPEPFSAWGFVSTRLEDLAQAA